MAKKSSSFSIEGIELRGKEKPINETVPQSLDISFDGTNSSSIFLHDDGQLYFKDNANPDPVPLSKVKNFYNRLRFEDGELRFYDEDIGNYVTLSDINATRNVVIKPSSLLYSLTKKIDNPKDYDAISYVNSVVENFGLATNSLLVDFFEDGKKLLKEEFTSGNYKLNLTDTSPVDALIEYYLDGLTVERVEELVLPTIPEEPIPPAQPNLVSPEPVDTTGKTATQIQTELEVNQTIADLINEPLEDAFELAEEEYETLLEEYNTAIDDRDAILAAVETVAAGEVDDDELIQYKTVYSVKEEITLPSENTPYTYLPNLRLFFQDDHISFRKAVDDFPGKVELQGRKFEVFENYVLARLERFNGIGKFVSSVLGRKRGLYADLENNDPMLLKDLDEGTFTINALRNSACGGEDNTEKPFSFNSSYPLFVGEFIDEGLLSVEYQSGTLQIRDRVDSSNAKILADVNEECSDIDGYIGNVKTNAQYTYANVDFSDEKYTQKDSDVDELNGPFYVNPYGEEEDWIYHHDLEPFDSGPEFDEILPIRRQENCYLDQQFGGPSARCPIFETFPFCRGTWCNKTKFPPDAPEIKGFPTNFQGELWSWYNVADNKGNTGDITYSYKWEPLDGNTSPIRSKVRGIGVFNDIPQLREFQNLLLQDISKGISYVFSRFIIDEYKSIFLRDNILTTIDGIEYFRDETEVLSTVDFDDYFSEIKSRFRNRRKDDLKESINNVIDWCFDISNGKV
jgi:hypothetical protein